MSNSFSPKNAPNLNQERLEKLLVALRQPFSIAVLASLGLHGVLWAALPNMLADTAKVTDTQRRVQTVELSPAEQSQLPSFGINQVPTPLPTNPTKPAQSGTKLPDPNKPYSYPLDTIPVFPPPNIYPNDFSSLFPKNLPEPQTEPKKQSSKPNKATVPPPPPDPKASERPVEPANPSGKGDKVAEPARSQNLSSEQIAALRKDAQRSRELRDLYQSDGSYSDSKAIAAATKNAPEFVNEVNKLAGNNFDSRRYDTPDTVNDLFPKEACPFIQELRRATIFAIVKPDGQLAETPTLIRPSGVKGLDSIAIEHVKAQKFSPSSKYQIVRVEFKFDPKATCKSAGSQPS